MSDKLTGELELIYLSEQWTVTRKTEINLPANQEKFVIFPFGFSRSL